MSAMIDCDSTWNLISHLLAEKYCFSKHGKILSGLKTVDGLPLQVYGQHRLTVDVRDFDGKGNLLPQTFFSMPITGDVQIIVGLPWLKDPKPWVNW